MPKGLAFRKTDESVDDLSDIDEETPEFPVTTLQEELEKEDAKNFLQTLDDISVSLENMNIDNVGDDEIQDKSQEAEIELEGSRVIIRELRERLAKKFNSTLWEVVTQTLFNDKSIAMTADTLGIAPEQRITRMKSGNLQFHLLDRDFDEWRIAHQNSLGVDFVSKRPTYKYMKEGFLERDDYYCHRGKKPYIHHNRIPGGVSGKTRIREPSIYCGCEAAFTTKKQLRVLDTKEYYVHVVEYNFRHNHSVGTRDKIGTQRKSKIIKNRIDSYVHQGRTIQNIMHVLSVGQDRFLDATEGDGPRITRDDIVTYENVCNVVYKINNKEARKHADPFVSANMWMTEFENKDYFTYYDPQGSYYGFSTTWQLEQLKTFGDVFCFDGTHEAFGRGTYLFSIIVKSRVTGTGVPVAFIITRDSDSKVLIPWLTQLQTRMRSLGVNFQPKVVITDQGNAEIKAIKHAFPDADIFYCAWHVLQAWERFGCSYKDNGIGSLPKDERTKVQQKLRTDLKSILCDRSKESAALLIEKFREDWKEYDEILQYFEKNYFAEAKMEQWMLCHRQGISYANIDTNNYIEPWHNTLKRYFLKDNRIQHHDRVLYTLAKIALPHYQRKCMIQNLGVGTMTTAQRKASDSQRRAIEQLNQVSCQDILMGIPVQNVLAIKSFADPSRIYNIGMDFSKRDLGHFTSCTCLDFSQSRMVCKHILLAMMIIPFIEFEYRGNWEVPDDFVPIEPEEQPIDQASAQKTIPPVDMFEIYLDKINSLVQARDPNVPVPEHLKAKIDSLAKELYATVKESFVLEGSNNPRTKRPRMGY